MNSLRLLLMLAVIVVACFVSTTFSEHHEASNANAFQDLYQHLLPAKLTFGEDHSHEAAATLGDGDAHEDAGFSMAITNLQVFQIASVLLILLAFSGVPAYLKSGQGDRLTRTLTGFCIAIRDEMVYPAMGEQDGNKFLPFFLSIFWFIFFMNVMGLLPFSVTPTASIFVTAGLATITLGAMIGCGMVQQGPVAFWKNLVPPVPGWLWPLMFLVELIGLVVKPVALTIRLFANMAGGHMVVLSFMGLIFFFAGTDLSTGAGYGISLVSVPFAIFIMIIEGFVAMLQAYIFTQLSIIFVGLSIHPEH